jgi:hypothetical protein
MREVEWQEMHAIACVKGNAYVYMKMPNDIRPQERGTDREVLVFDLFGNFLV